MDSRIRNNSILQKVMSPKEASLLIKDGMNVATSGFTPSGYPKAVPLALAERLKESGEKIRIGLLTGASVGDELDGLWARENLVAKRFPYQTNKYMRNNIND